MNVKKNPFYYINTIVFLVLSIYSLLLSINVFDMDNIDMNAGLCAVIVSMVLCLVMYMIYVTRVRTMLTANPILKTSLEVISVLIFLTLSCVVRVYLMGEFELDIMREGIVLLCMIMAYFTARMLNQYGFVTLMLLVLWPYLISTYNYDLQELILFAAAIAGICVLSVILFAVRKKHGLRLAAMVLFLSAVTAYFIYEVYQADLTSVYVDDYKKYIEYFNRMFQFTQFERYYYIAVVMAAIIGGMRLLIGSGSADTLILFTVNVLCFFTVVFDLGPTYLHFMYPLLAMAASGSLGTRPSYEDEEVLLSDNLENVQVKYNKKDVVGLSYVDDSELDRMLEDIEKEHKYIPHKNLSELSEENDENIPVELKVYDSALGVIGDEKENMVSNPEPEVQTPAYEPVTPVMTPKPEPVAQTPVYEPEAPVMTPEPKPIAQTPVYEPEAPVMTPKPEPIAQTPVYEPVASKAPVIEEPVIPAPVFETSEESAQEPKQPEISFYEPEYHYEEETPSYEPEYHYEEEKTAAEQTVQIAYEEPAPAEETVVPEPVYEPAEEPIVPESFYEPAEEPVMESKTANAPEYQYEEPKPSFETISYTEPVYENFAEEKSYNLEPQLLIKNPVSFEDTRDTETTGDNMDYGFIQSKPMFETMASFFSNQLDDDHAPKFEMSQRDAASFDAYSAADEIYTPIDSMDELFTNADAGLEFEEVDSLRHEEKPYNEDDELVEEPVLAFRKPVDEFEEAIAPVVLDKPEDDGEIIEESVINSIEPQQTVIMPENVELGLDLDEELGFGQTISFTDFYDTDNTPVFTEFEEVEKTQETTDFEAVVELPEPEVQMPVTEEIAAAKDEVPAIEEIAAVKDEVPVAEEAAAPAAGEFTVSEAMPPLKETEILEMEPVFVQPEPETHIEDIPVVPTAQESHVEPGIGQIEKESVKQINPFAKEDDFFDWSTYDGSIEEEQEPVVEEIQSVPVKAQAADDFEEFVWTDEMIKQFSDGGDVTVSQIQTILEEDDMPEVIKEIAATTVQESVFEPEEEMPQYQVYQSSGNFRFEEPQEEEEAPQYRVYQSSGNFQLEEEEEEPAPMLITYGGPQQNAEPVPAETKEKPAAGNKFGEFEFDLDLPNFEPLNPAKR